MGLRLFRGARVLHSERANRRRARVRPGEVACFQGRLVCRRPLSIEVRITKVPEGSALDMGGQPVLAYARTARAEDFDVAGFQLGREEGEFGDFRRRQYGPAPVSLPGR